MQHNLLYKIHKTTLKTKKGVRERTAYSGYERRTQTHSLSIRFPPPFSLSLPPTPSLQPYHITNISIVITP